MRILRKIFGGRNKYTPPVGDGRPDGNWSVGDLAVCCAEGGWTGYHDGMPIENPPQLGEVFRVSGVGFVSGIHVLTFCERGVEWFTARSFRKAAFDEHKACEPDFVTLLRRSKPKVRA